MHEENTYMQWSITKPVKKNITMSIGEKRMEVKTTMLNEIIQPEIQISWFSSRHNLNFLKT
jgi:hypothetical protein